MAEEGLLKEGFFWIPSLGGPTTLAAQKTVSNYAPSLGQELQRAFVTCALGSAPQLLQHRQPHRGLTGQTQQSLQRQTQIAVL